MATFLPHSEFTQLASDEQIAKTVQALEAHGMRAVVFETGEEARNYVLDLIPSGAEVYNSPSRTLELIGLAEDIEHPTRFQSVRAHLHALDRVTQRDEMRKLGASPAVLVGSVHAITEQGEIMIASATRVLSSKRSSHEVNTRSHRQKQNEGRTRTHDLFTEIT